MENKTFLQELIKEGLLSEELAKKILQESSLVGKNAEELIYERRLADEETVAKIKSRLESAPEQEWEVASPL